MQYPKEDSAKDMVSLLKEVREVCAAYTSENAYENPFPKMILIFLSHRTTKTKPTGTRQM